MHSKSQELPAASDNEAPQVFFVCSICLRQYSLIDDLRGHYIEYHKYRVNVNNKEGFKAPITNARSAYTVALEKETEKAEHLTPAQNKAPGSAEAAKAKPQVKPMPFKSFRCLLRAKLTTRCLFSCANKFENEHKLELHMKCHVAQDDNAEKVPPFKCYECDLQLENWRRCSSHLWKEHQIDVDLLHCPKCDFKAPQSVLVWRHMRLHKKWRARVLRSMRAVHQKRRREMLQNEKNEAPEPTVTKNRYYAEKVCDICERKFVNGKTLSKHVKTVHNKIKPFICNVCGKKTARKASLIVHMRQHTGEKPLHCKICKFATRDPSALHKHQLRHEKIGKFKCPLCAYNCIQSSAFKRHLHLFHLAEYKKISCDLCPYASVNAQRLEQHKEDHRKGLIVHNEDSMDTSGLQKLNERKENEMSTDCFLPLESVDSLPHEPALDTGGVTIPAPSEDTQFATYLSANE